jgi:hypothetical protein
MFAYNLNGTATRGILSTRCQERVQFIIKVQEYCTDAVQTRVCTYIN